MNKKIIIKIICLAVIAIVSITLVVLFGDKEKVKNEVKNNEETKEVDNSQSIISNEVIDDLKNNIGKGTNGDIVDVVQSKNEKGEAQYIFTYNDGTTQTITVKDGEGGSGIEEVDPNPQEEDKPQKEDPQEEPTHEEEEEKPVEDLGTVYERYANMSKYEQYAFYKTFDSQSEFVEWYKAAQAEYLKLHPTIEIGKDQYIDFGS